MRWSVTAARAVVKGMKHTGGSYCIASTLAIQDIFVLSALTIFGVKLQC